MSVMYGSRPPWKPAQVKALNDIDRGDVVISAVALGQRQLEPMPRLQNFARNATPYVTG